MRGSDDALLIALAQRGSLDAVAELFERYGPLSRQAAFARPTVAGFELSVGAWRRPDAALVGRRTRTIFRSG